MKAIIIDDDPMIRALLANVFQRKNFEVVTYANPTECPLYSTKVCPCQAEKPCPDIIITDYDMPFVNGVEFITALRKNGCLFPHIALMTGSSLPGQIIEQAAFMGVKFFAKPFHREQINNWLNQIEPSLHSREARFPDCKSG